MGASVPAPPLAGATYAIGDIHGCLKTFDRLVERLPIDWHRDSLWLVGDLVNRGPRSLETLRRVRELSLELDERLVAVMGNHDLHLLRLACGRGRATDRPALEEVLNAPDGDELLTWLAQRPLVHRRARHLLVHAGLMPQWSVDEAMARARVVEELFSDGDGWRSLFSQTLEENESAPLDYTLRVLTGIRTCRADGSLCDFTGPPEEAPKGCRPWFSHESRQSRDATIVAGHWAALGLRLEDDFLGIDTGCVYGNVLTAVRLEDRQVFQERNRD